MRRKASFRNLRAQFAIRRVMRDILLRITNIRTSARAGTNLLQRHTLACAIHIPVNPLAKFPTRGMGGIHTPLINLDAPIRGNIPHSEIIP